MANNERKVEPFTGHKGKPIPDRVPSLYPTNEVKEIISDMEELDLFELTNSGMAMGDAATYLAVIRRCRFGV